MSRASPKVGALALVPMNGTFMEFVMNITPKTRLRSLLPHGYFRDVLDAFDLPYERSWTLANACRAADADIDEVILELELAESEAEEGFEDEDAFEWAYAG